MGSYEIQGELWGKAAKDWTNLQEPMHKPLWEAMINACLVNENSHFFDAGCGGGGASILAAERGAQVSGLDASKPLIDIAREAVPQGDFRVGDMEHLPFADDSFDAVISANSLQYTADRKNAMQELQRVCSPNGRLSIGLWSTPDKVDFKVFFNAVRDTLPEPPKGDGPFGLSEPGILEALIKEVDMQVLKSEEVNCPFEYQDFNGFWLANVSAGPVQGALKNVSEDLLKTSVKNAIEPFEDRNGSIRMNNYFRFVVAAF